MKKLRKLTLLVLLALLFVPVCVFSQAKVTGYTTWDDTYFYAAFLVDDPDITGSNTQPHSSPWEDDCVEIFIETDNKHNPGRPASTYHMAVSAAGGCAFTVGSDSNKWEVKRIISFKYSTIPDGSVGNPEDFDSGYVVEMALPWFELGVKPPTPGTMMSFNAVVRMRGESDKFVSLSPEVKTEEDIHDASKWVNIVFTGPALGAATLSMDKIVSARYVTRMPLIDGQLRPKEWNANTSFNLTLPIDVSDRPKHQFQKMLLTYYFYWYQADPRKAAPYSHIKNAEGRIDLTDLPLRSAGPWFSYDRVQWHKDELTDIKRAGIDIILPVYWGDPVNRAGFAAKGLDCMVEAIRELQAEKRPYPLIGMFFDTTAMQLAYGEKPDLRDEEVKRTFYGMIRDFFMRIPEEYRAQVQMSDERTGRPCYIVQLYTCNWFSELDSSFIDYVNERFAKDFNAGILWIGSQDYKEKAPVFDGYCNYGAGLSFGYDESSKIRIAAVGAGYDDTAVIGRKTPIRARDAGDTYKADWTKALDKRPNWIMVDGWNELHEGSDICASRQYGYTYIDATALNALKFKGAREYEAKYLKHNLPEVIMPGSFYHVTVTVQNDGLKPWKVAEGYALAYRWYQNNVPVGESGIKRPIQQDIMPGSNSEISIGVAAVQKDNNNLPEGDYEIRFEMVRMRDDKWFSALGDEGLTVPIRIGKVESSDVRYISVDGPVMMKTATDYTYKIKVRNDTSTTWKAGSAYIGCKLFKVSSYLHGGPDDIEQEVPISALQALLASDVAPGQVAEVEMLVNLKDPNGQPIPVWKQSEPWSYQLRFDVFDGEKWLSEAGARTYNRIVDVFEADYGARIVASNTPETMEAGKTVEVKLVVNNTGPDAWTPKRHSFGYHWYHLDGAEAVWDGIMTPINTEVKPGQPFIATVKVTAPPYDGRYILAFDFAEDGKWASTSEISRGGDMLLAEVTVKNGKLAFVDLSKLFDTVASSTDRNRSSGNFDGSGMSFPAEFMPPDIGFGSQNDIYPCGYGWKTIENGLANPSRISFRYGPKDSGAKNAVACAGQTVAVPKGKYVKLHVLGAATAPDQEAEFGLGYQSATAQAKVKMSSWGSEPVNGEEVAFMTLHRHSPSGDQRNSRCLLFRYEINLDPSSQLSSIILPKNDKIRVLAITLEKQ